MNSPPLSGGKRKLGEIDLLEAARASARALVSKFEPAKQAASAYASYASTYGASLTPHAYGYAPPVSDSTSAWTAAAAAAGPQVVQSYTRERVGRIIGPGGCNITVIRKESGAKIKIDSNCVAGHQQVTYSGTDAEIQAAIALVERLLATPDLGGQGEAADGAPRAEHKQELDKESAGKVIGQGGATIKNIRESSGAYIKISNEKIPGVETQTLTVGGTEEQVRMRLSSGACFIPLDGLRPRGFSSCLLGRHVSYHPDALWPHLVCSTFGGPGMHRTLLMGRRAVAGGVANLRAGSPDDSRHGRRNGYSG